MNEEKEVHEIVNKKQEEIFNVVETDKGYFIGLGNARITDLIEDEKVLFDKIANKDWDVIVSVIMYLLERKEK